MTMNAAKVWEEGCQTGIARLHNGALRLHFAGKYPVVTRKCPVVTCGPGTKKGRHCCRPPKEFICYSLCVFFNGRWDYNRKSIRNHSWRAGNKCRCRYRRTEC